MVEIEKHKFSYGEKAIQEELMHKDIKKRIINELSKQIVGEKKSIDTILTCFIGSKVENAQLTSFNLLVNDESGVGKDWVVNHILKLFPKDTWEHKTRISPTALCYYHNAYEEPEFSWNGKIFYLEDPSNEILNSDVIKLLASSGSDAIITIKPGKTIRYKTNGKPVLITTMARSNPKEETVRRFNIVNLDSGIDQTDAIMDRQIETAKTGKTLNYDPLITDCIAYLKRKPVLLTFLEQDKVKKMFPKGIIIRTQLNRFLDYVKAQTIISQLQRQTYQLLPTEPEFLLGTEEDWNNAIEPFMKSVTNPLFIPLTKNDQKLLNIVENFGDQFNYVSEIAEKCTFYAEKWIYVRLQWLADKGFLEQDKIEKPNSDKKVFAYRFIKHINFKIKKW